MNQHTVTFDKLIYLDRLKSVGVPEEVARAHADGLDQALRESVATRADLDRLEAGLKTELDRLETGLKADLDRREGRLDARIDAVERKVETLSAKVDGMESKLDAKIDALDKKLDSKIDTAVARLETKIAEAQIAAARWTFGAAVGFAGLVWAIVKYSR